MTQERSLILAGLLAFLMAGCASNPPAPSPAQAPPPQPIQFTTGLTPDQMNRLCAADPDTCARVKAGQPLSVDDVKAMARLGFPSDTINGVVRNSHTVYHLTANQIVDLKAAGVGDKVIDFLLATPNYTAETMSGPATSPYPPPQVPPPAPPAEAQPPAPGPDYVWVDGDWVWNGGWIWAGGHWAYPPYRGARWYHGAWIRGGHGYRHDRGWWH